MNIFDDLKTITSTWLPELRPFVNRAVLIHCPIVPHEELPHKVDSADLAKIMHQFRLPYPITAVEDKASCVILIDPKPGMQGFDQPRMFIDCVPFDNDEENYRDSDADRSVLEAIRNGSKEGLHSVAAGLFASPRQDVGTWTAWGELWLAATGTPQKQCRSTADFHSLPRAAQQIAVSAAIRNAMTACEELLHFGTVSHPPVPPSADQEPGRLHQGTEVHGPEPSPITAEIDAVTNEVLQEKNGEHRGT